jgi:hypothetical protein
MGALVNRYDTSETQARHEEETAELETRTVSECDEERSSAGEGLRVYACEVTARLTPSTNGRAAG